MAMSSGWPVVSRLPWLMSRSTLASFTPVPTCWGFVPPTVDVGCEASLSVSLSRSENRTRLLL